jgi:hypothetical protein
MFDEASRLKVLDAFTPVAAQAADANGPIIDCQGYEAVTILVDLGAEGWTLTTSNYVELTMNEGNDSGLSDAAVVPASEQIGAWETPASGIFKRIDAPAEAPAVYVIGLKPSKRYVRLTLDFTGTVTGGIPAAAVAVLSHARHQPAGVAQTP